MLIFSTTTSMRSAERWIRCSAAKMLPKCCQNPLPASHERRCTNVFRLCSTGFPLRYWFLLRLLGFPFPARLLDFRCGYWDSPSTVAGLPFLGAVVGFHLRLMEFLGASNIKTSPKTEVTAPIHAPSSFFGDRSDDCQRRKLGSPPNPSKPPYSATHGLARRRRQLQIPKTRPKPPSSATDSMRRRKQKLGSP